MIQSHLKTAGPMHSQRCQSPRWPMHFFCTSLAVSGRRRASWDSGKATQLLIFLFNFIFSHKSVSRFLESVKEFVWTPGELHEVIRRSDVKTQSAALIPPEYQSKSTFNTKCICVGAPWWSSGCCFGPGPGKAATWPHRQCSCGWGPAPQWWRCFSWPGPAPQPQYGQNHSGPAGASWCLGSPGECKGRAGLWGREGNTQEACRLRRLPLTLSPALKATAPPLMWFQLRFRTSRPTFFALGWEIDLLVIE